MKYSLNNLTPRSFLQRIKLLCKKFLKFLKFLAVFGSLAGTIASPRRAT